MSRIRSILAAFALAVAVMAPAQVAQAAGSCGDQCQQASKEHVIVAPKGFYWDFVSLRRQVQAICDYHNANAGADWTPEMQDHDRQMYADYQTQHDALERKLQRKGQPPIAPSIGDWIVAKLFRTRFGNTIALNC